MEAEPQLNAAFMPQSLCISEAADRGDRRPLEGKAKT
jgi:hypothetical protein